jgi:phosphoribosylglycinamide formyltransferase-1
MEGALLKTLLKKRWAVFISGTGSNLGALLEQRGSVDLRLVVSSSSQAHGLLKAKRAGVPTLILSKPIDWQSLLVSLKEFNVNAIFLAGFMKIIPQSFIEDFKGFIVNLHPSLLPAYPGLQSIEKAFQDQKPLGVSVHAVIPEVDAGEILLQRRTEAHEDFKNTEFLVHVSEQRLVREVISKC